MYKVKYLQRSRNWEHRKRVSLERYPITARLASALLSKGIRGELSEEYLGKNCTCSLPNRTADTRRRPMVAVCSCDIHMNTRLTASSHFVIAFPMRPITHQLNKWNCHSCPRQPRCHARLGTVLCSCINVLYLLVAFFH